MESAPPSTPLSNRAHAARREADRPALLYCRCEYTALVPQSVREAVLGVVRDSGLECIEVGDLCALAARRDPLLGRLAALPGVRIAACQPRAVKWLFDAAGAPLDPDRTEVVNLRSPGALEAVRRLSEPVLRPNLPPGRSRTGEAASQATGATSGGDGGGATVPTDWMPWFPVIDYDRCIGCLQCLSFCLFGVYGVDGDGAIEVQNPAGCKTHCPACARVCPEGAIVFPKYKRGPIAGGEEGEEGPDAAPETTKVDLASLLKGDVHALLRARGGDAPKRFSPLRDSDQAFLERKRHLVALAQSGDIPPEALSDLPDAAELRRRAEAARLKAQAALDARKQP